MCDRHWQEFFMLIPCEDGRQYREARATAVEAIYTAIEQGCEPGEVRFI